VLPQGAKHPCYWRRRPRTNRVRVVLVLSRCAARLPSTQVDLGVQSDPTRPTHGGLRSEADRTDTLNKPFAAVSEEIELDYPFTQRGMRGTFNDLMRPPRWSR
jgi:hypothetical protein